MRRLRALILAAAAAALLAGCGNLGIPNPVTAQGKEARDLWRIFVVIAVVIGLIVYALVVFVVVRYRRRRHAASDALPSQRQYHVPLEILYTAIPIVIVAILLGLSIRAENNIDALSPSPDVTVDVTGFQWQWQFRYEGSPVVVTGTPGAIPTLVLPTGTTVRLKLVSEDVVHSFWVPHFVDKRDLTPGVDSQIDVKITEVGEWRGVCSEFCGLDHWKMTFSVRAVSPADYQTWLASGGTTTP